MSTTISKLCRAFQHRNFVIPWTVILWIRIACLLLQACLAQFPGSIQETMKLISLQTTTALGSIALPKLMRPTVTESVYKIPSPNPWSDYKSKRWVSLKLMFSLQSPSKILLAKFKQVTKSKIKDLRAWWVNWKRCLYSLNSRMHRSRKAWQVRAAQLQ